jgi:hypothetical protein
MQPETANPVYVLSLCVLRCVIPLLVLLGMSYIFRRLGLVKSPPVPPNSNMENSNHAKVGGGG